MNSKKTMDSLSKGFSTSTKPHVLMITNHGLHQWDIVPGLPDTGGQNVFVNQFTEALTKLGFKITITNRGGYEHLTTGEMQAGISYKDENQRILWLEDEEPEFVRKEDMDKYLPGLCNYLQGTLEKEGSQVDLIISHYWDGAKLGMLYNRKQTKPVKHIWVPHSLGEVKKRNVDPARWKDLRVDERIINEAGITAEVDRVAATSATIRESLVEDYHYRKTPLFLPPCIDPQRYHPRELGDHHPIWEFIGKHAGITSADVRSRTIITEISRTDTTKRKNILIKAFASIHKKYPETLLVLTIDRTNQVLAEELFDLIHTCGIQGSVAALGSVWDELPDIYAATDIYLTPSIMEGFGMTPQEAAATSVPVISSNLVPFVVEYLLGSKVQSIPYGEDEKKSLRIGEGAIVVGADDIEGFTKALEIFITNADLRHQMGKDAYQITIPYFTWDHMVKIFLEEIDFYN
jgi:glycosyltransferase involved in cell wall biosynthesis